MTDQEIIDDIFDNSRYYYPKTFKFLCQLPNTVKTETGIRFQYQDVFDYIEEHKLQGPFVIIG